MPVLGTVWRFLATNNLRFFLSLNILYYRPYQYYIRDSDNLNDEGEWDIRIDEPGRNYTPQWQDAAVFEQPHFDLLLASVFPFTSYLLGDVGYSSEISEYTNDDQIRSRMQMASLLQQVSDLWRDMQWK